MKNGNGSLIFHPVSEENLNKILALLKKVKYGTITLVIQNGVLVQIEHTDKERLC